MFPPNSKYPVKPQLPTITDHNNLPAGTVELARINDALNYKDEFVFVRNAGGLSIVRAATQILANGREWYFCTQTDLPLGFLSWFPAALRDFQKPPAKGGLHAGAMESSDQDVEGEMLCIQRLMDAGNRQQGYCAMNRSRCERQASVEGYFEPQEVNFAENFLNKGGLLKLIEDLGVRYKKGRI